MGISPKNSNLYVITQNIVENINKIDISFFPSIIKVNDNLYFGTSRGCVDFCAFFRDNIFNDGFVISGVGINKLPFDLIKLLSENNHEITEDFLND